MGWLVLAFTWGLAVTVTVGLRTGTRGSTGLAIALGVPCLVAVWEDVGTPSVFALMAAGLAVGAYLHAVRLRLRYRVFVPLASLLPEGILRWLDHHVPVCKDPVDSWSFWTDASYWKWCRWDRRRGDRDGGEDDGGAGF